MSHSHRRVFVRNFASRLRKPHQEAPRETAARLATLKKYKTLLFDDEGARAQLAQHIREGGIDEFESLLSVDRNLARLTAPLSKGSTHQIGVPFLLIEGLKSAGVTPKNVDSMIRVLQRLYGKNPEILAEKIGGLFPKQFDKKIDFVTYAAHVLDLKDFRAVHRRLKQFVPRDRLRGNR